MRIRAEMVSLTKCGSEREKGSRTMSTRQPRAGWVREQGRGKVREQGPGKVREQGQGKVRGQGRRKVSRTMSIRQVNDGRKLIKKEKSSSRQPVPVSIQFNANQRKRGDIKIHKRHRHVRAATRL